MNHPEQPQSQNPEQFEHKKRASSNQLVLLYSQIQSLFDIAQTPRAQMFEGATVSFDQINNEAVYVLPGQKRGSIRELHIRQDGIGFIFDYRSQVDRLHAIRGMTLKADGLDSHSESAVYEEDHLGFFWAPEPVLIDQSHYEGVPQNYAEVAQDYLDELWTSVKTNIDDSLITQ